MNVSELARRLKVSPNELLDMLPQLGIHIGRRSIKVDDRTAWKIIESWPRLLREWRAKHPLEKVEKVEEAEKIKTEVELPPITTVREFAVRLGLPVTRVITELMKNGILAALNERIDFTTASIIAQDLGYIVKESKVAAVTEATEVKDVIKERIGQEHAAALQPRSPVVVVMGHVDHGKTKTLDAIRTTNVVAGEAGGITQHIGAYQTVRKDRRITFIDTPGHEAFTTMRSRGARVADVAILVVAADDGVQPQTVEALNIINAAKLPFVVAVNKMDKPEASTDRVKRELAEKGVLPEDWGGKVPFVPISAKAGTGIDALLDVILLLADLERERTLANPEARALGTVIESHVDAREGVVATILIQNGTLKVADALAVGQALYGRVRAMKDWSGRAVKAVPPGMPVKILGLKVAPEVGDIIEVPEDTQVLEVKKAVAQYREMAKLRPAEEIGVSTPASGAAQTLVNVVVKADVLGSLEAISSKLETLQTAEVGVKVITKGLGNITEAEVLQAAASNAIVYGFHVVVPPKVAELAREKEVEVQTYKIIYELLDDIKGRLQVLLKPELIYTALGTLKVLAVFRKEKSYAIIGGRVEDGKAVKGAKLRIARAGVDQGEGIVTDLQSAKQSVAEVPGGSECGLKVTTQTTIQEGDVLEMYKEEKKERKLVF